MLNLVLSKAEQRRRLRTNMEAMEQFRIVFQTLSTITWNATEFSSVRLATASLQSMKCKLFGLKRSLVDRGRCRRGSIYCRQLTPSFPRATEIQHPPRPPAYQLGQEYISKTPGSYRHSVTSPHHQQIRRKPHCKTRSSEEANIQVFIVSLRMYFTTIQSLLCECLKV